MKTVRIVCTWRSAHLVEVPDDWEVPSRLDGFPEDILEEMTPQNAELWDWE